MLGLSLSTFTTVHVILCLVAIASGLIVIVGLLAAKRLDGWTALYLLSALAASATGFGFPFEKLLPSHILGIVSLVVLIVAALARYLFHLAGTWRAIYAVGAVLGVYFQVFVGIVQAFLKVPALSALAPTQTEPPFAITQGVALVIFIAWAIAAAIKFHPPERGIATTVK
jgi:hypothetical protein